MPPTVNQQLLDRTILQLIESDQIAAEFADDVAAFLGNELLPAIGAEIDRKIWWNLTDAEKIEQMRISIAEQIEGAGLTESILVSLIEFATNEANAVALMMDEVIPVTFQSTVPAPSQIQALVNDTPFNNRVMKKWIDDYSKEIQDGLFNDIRQAILDGDEIDWIAERLLKNQPEAFKAGNAKRALRDAKTVARTATNAVNAAARELTYMEMSKWIKGVQYLATLDSVTSAICISLHGTVWPIGEGPRPPQHWNCRSTTVPVARSWQEMGIDANDIDVTVQASMDGQVVGVKSFEDWLKTQPIEVAEKLLGKHKARLWKSGQIGTLLEIIGPDGNWLTLNSLGYTRSGKPLAA